MGANMARSVHIEELSPHLRGSIFSQRVRKNSKSKPQPGFSEVLSDYQQLLSNLLGAFTQTVNQAHPNADFLANQPGSKINPDTKLSFVLRSCFGLSQMQLPSQLVENYRQTLKLFLKDIQHSTTNNALYSELRNIVHVYQSLANAMNAHQSMNGELKRLNGLELPPKTVDRRLQERASSEIEQPVADLNQKVDNAMGSNHLQSFKLAGCNHSLAGLARQVNNDSPKTQRTSDNSEQFHQQVISPAA